ETNRSYLELLQTIKKNNQAYNENLKNIINGTGALNQQATAAKGVASALAGMAARYISLGGAAEAARRSFMNFAETEKKLLLLQNRTRATADEIERTGKKVKQTSQDTATGFDDTLASIERMRTGLKMSTADAEKMSARVNVVAQGMGLTSEELSKSVTSAMRNLKIPSDQLSQVLEMQAAAQREFGVNIKGNEAAFKSLVETASQFYQGKEGLAVINSLLAEANELTDDSAESMRLVASTLQLLAESGEEIRGNAKHWKKELEDVKARGGDVGAFMLNTFGKMQDKRQLLEKADANQKKFLNKLDQDNNGTIEKRNQLMKDSVNINRAYTDGLNVLAGSAAKVSKMTIALEGLSEEFGHLLETVGAPTALVFFTEKLNELGEMVEKVRKIFKGEVSIIGAHGLQMPSPYSVGKGMLGGAQSEADKWDKARKQIDDAKKRLEAPAAQGGAANVPVAPTAGHP